MCASLAEKIAVFVAEPCSMMLVAAPVAACVAGCVATGDDCASVAGATIMVVFLRVCCVYVCVCVYVFCLCVYVCVCARDVCM